MGKFRNKGHVCLDTRFKVGETVYLYREDGSYTYIKIERITQTGYFGKTGINIRNSYIPVIRKTTKFEIVDEYFTNDRIERYDKLVEILKEEDS